MIDLDAVVSANAGKSISDIFAEGGEAKFRDLESTALETVSLAAPSVISLGGGTVLRAANRSIVRATGSCFWLDCDAETLAARLAHDPASDEQRPALTQLGGLGEIRELLNQRHPHYQDASDHRIDTAGKPIEQVADEIRSLIEAESAS